MNSPKKLKDMYFYIIIPFLAFLESFLIIIKAIPPEASISFEFIGLRVLLVAFLFLFGWKIRDNKKAIKKGFTVAILVAIISLASIFLGKALGIPVLGISFPNLLSLYIFLIINTALILLIGTFVVFLGSLISKSIKNI
jgi:hypothetical protein